MRILLATTVLSSMLTFPAMAQMASEGISCADFVAMDSSGQLKTLESMGSGMKSEGAMQSEGAMKSGDMASDAMKSGDAMESGARASGDPMPPTLDDLAKACADHPDMTVQDAMGIAHGER
jgi:hypothetical protein